MQMTDNSLTTDIVGTAKMWRCDCVLWKEQQQHHLTWRADVHGLVLWLARCAFFPKYAEMNITKLQPLFPDRVRIERIWLILWVTYIHNEWYNMSAMQLQQYELCDRYHQGRTVLSHPPYSAPETKEGLSWFSQSNYSLSSHTRHIRQKPYPLCRQRIIPLKSECLSWQHLSYAA